MLSKNQLKYVRQLEHKKYRRREGLFVAEGPKVVGDLLAAGFNAKHVFATEDWHHEGVTAQVVSDEELCRLSFLQHPQQVLALFTLPDTSCLEEQFKFNNNHVPNILQDETTCLALALDGVQDPGNLGTIIRVADWFGISTIFCSEDTADAFSPKTVQATMGSIARVNIIYTNIVELLSSVDLPVYGTLLDGRNIYAEQLERRGIIVMGNEGNGISAEVRRLVTNPLLIPSFHKGPESLNVAIATAITCSEFMRR